MLGFPYNISAKAGASAFKFGMQLGFAKAHHKITRRRKGGGGPGLREHLKIWGFPFNIYTMAKASDFKFGTQLGFTRPIIKITPIRREKWAWPWAMRALQKFVVSLQYLHNG